MYQTAARPKNGRPLQNPLPTKQDDFVAAVPSRIFRDGTGIFVFKPSHYHCHRTEKDLLGRDAYDARAGGTPAAVLLDEYANDTLRAIVTDAAAGALNCGCVRQHGNIR